MNHQQQRQEAYNKADYIQDSADNRLGNIGSHVCGRTVNLVCQVVLQQGVQRSRQGYLIQDLRNAVLSQGRNAASCQGLVAQLRCRVSIGRQGTQNFRIVLDHSCQLRAQPEAEAKGKQASAHGRHRRDKSTVQSYQYTQSQDRQDHNVHNVHLTSFPPAGLIISLLLSFFSTNCFKE